MLQNSLARRALEREMAMTNPEKIPHLLHAINPLKKVNERVEFLLFPEKNPCPNLYEFGYITGIKYNNKIRENIYYLDCYVEQPQLDPEDKTKTWKLRSSAPLKIIRTESQIRL